MIGGGRPLPRENSAAGGLALASINEVNLAYRYVKPVSTEMGIRVRVQFPVPDKFISACNQPATQGQLSLPSLRGR